MNKGWILTQYVDSGLFEIIPERDLRPHRPGNTRCWCRPTVPPDDPALLIHHAADKREKYQGKGLHLIEGEI